MLKGVNVSPADARELALVGKIALEELDRSSHAASIVECDVESLRQVVTLAAAGPFQLRRIAAV